MLTKHYGRRRFLQTSALFAAGVAAAVANPLRTRAKDETVEAVVIGSGFGGAIAALRLGQAGINTVVVERGRRWPITPNQNTFAPFRKPDGRSAWLSSTTLFGDPIDVYTGVLERLDEDGITVLAGAGVGGGSLPYNAITYQPTRKLFYKSLPREISYEELDAIYYPRVLSMLKASPIPPDVLATNYYDTTRLLLENASKAGFPNRLLDLAVDWNIVREEIAGTKEASTIIGDHWWGINSGAKNSLDYNYLPQAESTRCVEILPLHIVTEITEVPGKGYKVSCNCINESGEVQGSKSLTCRYLFLAAGSVGTSKLLVRAKATGTLSKLNKNVGKFWGTNGDCVGNRSNLTPPVTGKGGPSGAVFEYHNNPYGPTATMNLEDWSSPAGTQRCLSLGIVSPKGTFKYDRATDSVKLHWPEQENKQLLLATENAFKTLDSSNATSEKTPKTEISPQICAHPLGGAVVGKACDMYGRVLGYKGLYVVDGALIPGSTGCTNPSFTIAALAERCMDKIIAEDLT